MRRKGVTDVMTSIIVDLIIIGLIMIFYFLLQVGYLDIHTIVKEAGVERHVLDLAQALLSYDKLIYTEGGRHRGIFVKEKLDEQFTGSVEFTYNEVTGEIIYEKTSDIPKELGYPNSDIRLYVKDLETGKEWTISYNGPFTLEGIRAVKDFNCIISKIRMDITMIFRTPVGNPWEIIDIYSCLQSSASSYGSAKRTFPVAIKDGENIHSGILKVAIYEWW